MAVAAIDATAKGADANSYATEAEAISYFEIHPEGEVWMNENASSRRAALLFAVKLIEREIFWGTKSTSTQALKFPRNGNDTVVTDVKEAQLEQALDLITKGYTKRLRVIEMKELGVRQVTAAETMQRMVPSFPFAFSIYKLSPTARELLSRYMEDSVQLGRA
jgi:hypothetical protein